MRDNEILGPAQELRKDPTAIGCGTFDVPSKREPSRYAGTESRLMSGPFAALDPKIGIGGAPTRNTTLPTHAKERKEYPMATGLLDYFPDALAAVAHISYRGNEQHNPGQPLNWARGKSADEADTLIRHMTQRGTLDVDGVRHSAKVAWRALAMLQKEIEESSPSVQQHRKMAEEEAVFARERERQMQEADRVARQQVFDSTDTETLQSVLRDATAALARLARAYGEGTTKCA